MMPPCQVSVCILLGCSPPNTWVMESFSDSQTQKTLPQKTETLTGNICKHANTKIELVSFFPSSLKWIVLEWAIPNTFLINPAPCLRCIVCIHEYSVSTCALEGLEYAVWIIDRSLIVLEWNDGIIVPVSPEDGLTSRTLGHGLEANQALSLHRWYSKHMTRSQAEQLLKQEVSTGHMQKAFYVQRIQVKSWVPLLLGS